MYMYRGERAWLPCTECFCWLTVSGCSLIIGLNNPFTSESGMICRRNTIPNSSSAKYRGSWWVCLRKQLQVEAKVKIKLNWEEGVKRKFIYKQDLKMRKGLSCLLYTNVPAFYHSKYRLKKCEQSDAWFAFQQQLSFSLCLLHYKTSEAVKKHLLFLAFTCLSPYSAICKHDQVDPFPDPVIFKCRFRRKHSSTVSSQQPKGGEHGNSWNYWSPWQSSDYGSILLSKHVNPDHSFSLFSAPIEQVLRGFSLPLCLLTFHLSPWCYI